MKKQKRSINPEVFCKYGVSEKLCKIHKKIPALGSLFDDV